MVTARSKGVHWEFLQIHTSKHWANYPDCLIIWILLFIQVGNSLFKPDSEDVKVTVVSSSPVVPISDMDSYIARFIYIANIEVIDPSCETACAYEFV